MKNTLAYYVKNLIITVKGFIAKAPKKFTPDFLKKFETRLIRNFDVNLIKLFTVSLITLEILAGAFVSDSPFTLV